MRIVLALSGGMDSATLLGKALSLGYEVIPCQFMYGSKHNRYEHLAAEMLINHYRKVYPKLKYTVRFDLTKSFEHFQSNLLQSGGDIPEGHYEAETMKQTVVPCRNAIFSTILAGFAESNGCEEVWLGIHAGDHAVYPDCRPLFYYSMMEALKHATDGKVSLQAPFLVSNKTSIIKYGLTIGVPYQFTRTCYKDQEVSCGKCGSCQERLEAFANNGIPDPLEYETRELLPKSF
jgi:7-cyano-7-deazaguanine synthase